MYAPSGSKTTRCPPFTSLDTLSSGLFTEQTCAVTARTLRGAAPPRASRAAQVDAAAVRGVIVDVANARGVECNALCVAAGADRARATKDLAKQFVLFKKQDKAAFDALQARAKELNDALPP